MKYTAGVASAACLVAGIAQAGGIERDRPAESILFEQGNYLQFSFKQNNPRVSGEHPATVGGGDTGDMADVTSHIGFGLKLALTDSVDVAVLLSQPYAANASYGEGFYNGLTAKWNSTAVDTLVKYNFNENISVYGGPSFLTSQADITIPFRLAALASGGSIFSPYTASSSTETDVGLVLGAAYEIPEYMARVALTYRSEIEHEFDARETYTQAGPGGFTPISTSTKTKVKMPQSVALDFQTGVAPGTLVFGSAKWTEWSKWEVRPGAYASETGREITRYEKNVMTYQLGVGRAINEQFSVFARVGHETKKGNTKTRLSPTDGYTSIGIGGSYTLGPAKITAGIEHAWLGDAKSSTPTDYSGNTATGFGLTLGFAF